MCHVYGIVYSTFVLHPSQQLEVNENINHQQKNCCDKYVDLQSFRVKCSNISMTKFSCLNIKVKSDDLKKLFTFVLNYLCFDSFIEKPQLWIKEIDELTANCLICQQIV